MAELTEVIRQKGDGNLVNIVNNIRIGKCFEDNVKQLQMRKIPIENVHPDATLLSAENSLKDDYNASKIGQLNHLEIKIESIDVFPDSTPMRLQTSLSSRSSSTTASFNCQFGVVFDFAYIDSSNN